MTTSLSVRHLYLDATLDGVDSLACQNRLHGQLLQIQLLLEFHLNHPTSSQIRHVFRREAVSLLLPLVRLTDEQTNPCPFTRAAVFRLLTDVFIRTNWLSADSFSSSFESDNPTEALSGFLPIRSQLLEFARSIFRADFANAPEFFELASSTQLQLHFSPTLFLQLLDHPVYEARFAALKTARRFIRADLLESTGEAIFERVIEARESHPGCQKQMFKLLRYYRPSTSPKRLSALLAIFEGTTCFSVRNALIPLLCDFSLYNEAWAADDMRIRVLNIVDESLRSCNDIKLRRAGFAGLSQLRPLFSDASAPFQRRVELWFTLMSTLQEDDASLRGSASSLVEDLLPELGSCTYVRALQAAYDHVVNLFVGDPEAVVAALLRGLSQISFEDVCGAAASQTLFAKEDPNFFREPLLDCQLAAQALAQCLRQAGDVAARTAKVRQQALLGLEQARTLFNESNSSQLDFTCCPRLYLFLFSRLAMLRATFEEVGELESEGRDLWQFFCARNRIGVFGPIATGLADSDATTEQRHVGRCFLVQ